MTTTTTIIGLGLLSALGMVTASALPEPSTDALPWKDIAGGGAALLMFATLVVFLRFLAAERTDRVAERKLDREHIERLQVSYTTSLEKCVAGEREDRARHFDALRASARDLHPRKP